MRRTTGTKTGSRANALWGGKTNSGTRSNGLWGGGSRGAAILLAGLMALVLVSISSPIAGADNSNPSSNQAYISPGLLSDAQANPEKTFDVIVQGVPSKKTDWVAQNVQSDATGVAQQDVSDAQQALQTVQHQWQDASNQARGWHQKLSQAQTDLSYKRSHKANAADVKQALTAVDQAQSSAAAADAQANQLDSQLPQLQTAVDQAQQEISQTQSSLDDEQQFSSIAGVHLTLTGRQIVHLSHRDGILSIVSNAPVKTQGLGVLSELPAINGLSNAQIWPWAVGAPVDWLSWNAQNAPTIAVLDSGIDTSKTADFGSRVLGQVNVSTLADNSPGDGFGHGTFVASIAAGSAKGHTGVDPYAKLYSVDVMDDQGMANIADVVAGCDWVLAHKDQYNIKVANLSLTGTTPASVMYDPLDQAVEKLWLNGIVVTAAAGNYNTNGQPSGVPYAPGNDPFVISAGAIDLGNSLNPKNYTVAPWSAFGYTLDGFSKPELGAPGRYMIGAVPANGGLVAERPDAYLGNGYMQLSGTSFAAPVIAGAAAYLLTQHPNWTPDQVKGALMVSALPTPAAVAGSDGVGEVNLATARLVSNPPNPNAGLDQYLTQAGDGTTAFDAAAWNSAAWNNAAWNSAAWSSAAWSSAAWSSAAWSSAAWSSAAWASAAWGSAAWDSAAWNSAAWNSAAWANNASADGAIDPTTTDISDTDAAAVAAELGVTLDQDTSGTTTTTTTTPTTTTTAPTTTDTTATTPVTTDTTTTATTPAPAPAPATTDTTATSTAPTTTDATTTTTVAATTTAPSTTTDAVSTVTTQATQLLP